MCLVAVTTTMGRFRVTTTRLLVLCALLAVVSTRYCVVSFQQVYDRPGRNNNNAFFLRTTSAATTATASTTTPSLSFTSSKQVTGSPILLQSALADGDADNNDDPSSAEAEPTSTPADHPYEYDLAVIGAGPVGVQAALLAASTAHKKVILIDAPRASGQLLNTQTNEDLSIGGPTGLFSKALRDAAKRIKVPTLRGMGLREDSIWNEITGVCVDLASFNAKDCRRQLEYAGVTLVEGYAEFEDGKGSHTLVVSPDNDGSSSKGETSVVTTDKVLIATGSRPFQPADIPFDGVRVFDSDSINGLKFLPKSVVITGSGIVAIEFAKIFSNLGCEDVTLLIRDNSPKNALMKIGLDKDIAATLVADIIRSGIKIQRACEVDQIEVPTAAGSSTSTTTPGKNSFLTPLKITLKAKGGTECRPANCVQEIKADAYIAAVGRIANTEKLNLPAANIEMDEYGGIKVDSKLRAVGPVDGNVYGAGDVLGRPFLASTGVAQGVATVRNMFPMDMPFMKDSITADVSCSIEDEKEGRCMKVEDELLSMAAACDPTSLVANPFAFPVGVWSSPEAAYYGLSMSQAKEMGIDAGEGISLYAECLRGLVFSPNGLLKLVFQKSTGRIVGVHICGEDACELIHYGMELVKTKRTVTDVASSLFSAVTYHEMYQIAAKSCMDPKAARKRRVEAGRALSKRRRNSSQMS